MAQVCGAVRKGAGTRMKEGVADEYGGGRRARRQGCGGARVRGWSTRVLKEGRRLWAVEGCGK